MNLTLQHSLICYGILCAWLGILCFFTHAYTPAIYLGLVGAIMGFMGGIVAWDTKKRADANLGRVIDSEIQKALDKPKE